MHVIEKTDGLRVHDQRRNPIFARGPEQPAAMSSEATAVISHEDFIVRDIMI
jgi:hypothetical protein